MDNNQNIKTYTLQEALARIDELESEIARLNQLLEKYEDRIPAGRKKHDAKWSACYDQFVTLYEAGDPIKVIIEKTNFSRRTVYRYKEYYDRLAKKEN